MKPYYEHDGITIYHADVRDLAPDLPKGDVLFADPPYGQTSLAWDRWPEGWLQAAAECTAPGGSLWCFGTLRMFMDHAAEYAAAGWQLAQDVAGKDVDVLWEKHNGSGFHTDRFRRIHEQVAQFYRGAWGDVYKKPQFTNDATRRTVRRKQKPAHFHGARGESSYTSHDGGPRLMRSVLEVRSMHGRAQNETEKPVDLVGPLVEFSCPPGGLILDLFCGAGPVLEVARKTGRRAIGIDLREEQCEIAARRLSQQVLNFDATWQP